MSTRKIDNIKQIYGKAFPQARLPALLEALQVWYYRNPAHNFLHPCVIEGKAALVCRGKLSRNAPASFSALQAIADEFDLYVKEDTRQQTLDCKQPNRRKSLALVLSFYIGMLGTSRLVTANELTSTPAGTVIAGLSVPIHTLQTSVSIDKTGQPVLHLKKSPRPAASEMRKIYDHHKHNLQTQAGNEEFIHHFLRTAYQPEDSDPAHIAGDMANIAHYFAQYPQTVELISALSGKNLQLKYKADNWQTQAWGNENGIDRVTIFFDTQIAAKFVTGSDCELNPACNISPADALLHELLHAKLMLLDAQHFIETGGLQPSLYPFEHEREVIQLENQLYGAMNRQDHLARPLRTRHSGELFHVDCALCELSTMASAE